MNIVIIAVAVFLAILTNANEDDDAKQVNYEINPIDEEECKKMHFTSLQCEGSNKLLNSVDEIVNYMVYRRKTFNDAELLPHSDIKYCNHFVSPEPCKMTERLEALLTLVFQQIEVTKKNLNFEESAKDMDECKAQEVPEIRCKFQVFLDAFYNETLKAMEKNDNGQYETEPISFNFYVCYDQTLEKFPEPKKCDSLRKLEAFIKDLMTMASLPERDEKYMQYIKKSRSICIRKNLIDDDCYADYLFSLFIRETVKNVVAEINIYRDDLVPRPTKCDDEKEKDETEIQCISAEILDSIVTRSIEATKKHFEE